VLTDSTLYHLWQQSNSNTHPRMEMVQQLVIPKSLRKEILYSCHEDLFSGHSGLKKTYERLRSRFYWDNMYKDALEHVQSCLDCEMKKFPSNTGTAAPVSLTHGPVCEPSQDWCVDLCGPFPLSRNGNRYACIFMDRFSRFPEAFGIPDKKAETVAKVLVEQIVCRYGCPRTLLSDRGGEFLSELSDETYKLMNIKKLNTSGYRPQTNGMVEKFNHTLVQSISQYISADQRDWDDFLPFACFQYRSSKNETTNESPYYLLFYRDMKMPLDRVYSHDEQFTSSVEYLKEVTGRFRAAKIIFEKQREAMEGEKKQFNDSIRKTINFDIGEVVLILKRYIKKGHVKKLTHLWRGPYVVVNKYPNQINYEVQLLKRGKDKHVVHASNMKRFHEPHLTHLSKKLKTLEEYDDEHSVEYEVERILGRKYENGEHYYLVKWKGYDSSESTWEPIKNMIHSREIIKEFELEREAHEKVC
jgi:transposase InsO family protein